MPAHQARRSARALPRLAARLAEKNPVPTVAGRSCASSSAKALARPQQDPPTPGGPAVSSFRGPASAPQCPRTTSAEMQPPFVLRHPKARRKAPLSAFPRHLRPLHEMCSIGFLEAPMPNALTAQRKSTRVNQVCFRILDLMPRARKASENHAEGMTNMVNAAGFLATRPSARKLAKMMDGVNKHG
jgi:hypothetical protein